MKTVDILVSVDTEEDQWAASRSGVTLENIRALPEVASWFRTLGVRPTWFVAWTVATDRWSGGWLGEEQASGDAEVGTHLHPWNTPPEVEALTDRNSMLCNLPPELVAEKLRAVTDAVAAVRGDLPESFRAGRFGYRSWMGPLLVAAGYRVDSSVVSGQSWASFGDGPSHIEEPMHIHRDGALTEVPVSVGFTRGPLRMWRDVQRRLYGAGLAQGRLAAAGWRLGVRKIQLSPEIHETEDMLAASRTLVRGGVGHLQLMLHSQSLTPGLSPFARNSMEVARIRARIERYMDGLSAFCNPRFATVAEAASR